MDLVLSSEDIGIPVINCSQAMQVVPPINYHIPGCSLIEKRQENTISKHTSLSSNALPEQQAGQVPSLYSVQSPSIAQETLFNSIFHFSSHTKLIKHPSEME